MSLPILDVVRLFGVAILKGVEWYLGEAYSHVPSLFRIPGSVLFVDPL